MDDLNFIDPTTLQPLFTAQQVVCAYPVSDLYASSPRYLYYALLALCFVTHWTGWLANVFLGAAATYAGTAAIHVFVLHASLKGLPEISNVTIPLVSTPLPSNLTDLQSLVVDITQIGLQPMTLELDIDPILAICVTGYLVLLPMQCWSRVVKANRARHLLISIWNLMMLAAAVTGLVVWPQTVDSPRQYRFCYPLNPDFSTITSDGWPSQVWTSDWNTTVWNLFSNLTMATSLSDNCFYPCFNTSQVLRKQTSISATVYTNDTTPRINYEDLESRSRWISLLPPLMYSAFGITAIATIYLTVMSWLRGVTRIPVGDPRLLWTKRKRIWLDLWTDVDSATEMLWKWMHKPKQAYSSLRAEPAQKLVVGALHFCRFWIDVLTLLVLLVAMILSPVSIVAFLAWIEWYIRHDGQNGETPRQVGQWTSSVAIALILVSAAILQLKYRIASAAELEDEIQQTREHLEKLQTLLRSKDKRLQRRIHSA